VSLSGGKLKVTGAADPPPQFSALPFQTQMQHTCTHAHKGRDRPTQAPSARRG